MEIPGIEPGTFRTATERASLSPYLGCAFYPFPQDESIDSSADLQGDVKEEDEEDEIWSSMEVVATKRKATPQPCSDRRKEAPPKDKPLKKRKKMKKKVKS